MKTKILITIDTEFSSHKDDMGIFGNIAGKFYGLPLFIQLAREYNLKFTFFIDVYGVREVFKKEFIKICNELISEGHELQLHTHPNGLFDKNRERLWMYSLDEQKEIIRKGKELFEAWFGIFPIAHRAGDWSANNDTFLALLANDIKIDSSKFVGYKHSRLKENNDLINHGKIIEIPPSTYKVNGFRIFNDKKILSSCGNPTNETLYVLSEMIINQRPIINIVYHSFSFLKWDKRRMSYWVSFNEIKKFKILLKSISKNENLELVQIKNLDLENYAYKKENEISAGSDYFIYRVMDRLKR